MNGRKMAASFAFALAMLATAAANAQANKGGDAKAAEAFLAQYKGTPYEDSQYSGGAQAIPGKVYCAYYDRGGEGVAYHDSDAKNNGSGALNPADGTYLNEFRMSEGVDTSYTKFGRDPKIDDTEWDRVTPPANLLYVGWTVAGEWFNVTVDVKKAGWYSADLLYTSNRGGAISLDVNGVPATGPLTIESTYDAKDPVAWRQWHHWNVARHIAKVRLLAGRNVVRVHIVNEGQMNLAYFEFEPA
ncbi:MAG TPA: hypothetical protein VL986_11415 [Terracidiphilus sp.]|nr:hypothetical protein [Terracidiphilus sp.]